MQKYKLVVIALLLMVLTQVGLASEQEMRQQDSQSIQLAENLFSQGRSFYSQGDYGAAMVLFDQALELNSDFMLAVRYRRAACVNLGLDECSFEAHLTPTQFLLAEELFWQGRSFYVQGDYGTAIVLFDQTLELNPNFVLAHQYRREAQAASGIH